VISCCVDMMFSLLYQPMKAEMLNGLPGWNYCLITNGTLRAISILDFRFKRRIRISPSWTYVTLLLLRS
jgi:hypothetical protein